MRNNLNGKIALLFIIVLAMSLWICDREPEKTVNTNKPKSVYKNNNLEDNTCETYCQKGVLTYRCTDWANRANRSCN